MNRIIRLLGRTPPPVPARIHKQGWLPERAVKYCKPLTDASNNGLYIFPPMDLDVVSRGDHIVISRLDTEQQTILQAADNEFLPRDIVKEALNGVSTSHFALPPIIAKFHEADIIQFWTGLMAVTDPGVGTLIRPLVNAVEAEPHQCLEGLIQTDWWRGPLIGNMRLRPGVPLSLRRDKCFAQVQFAEYVDRANASKASLQLSASQSDWDLFFGTDLIATSTGALPRRPGGYIRQARRT